MNAPLPRPVIIDQEGITLIGIKRCGATVIDRKRFLAAVAEADRKIAEKNSVFRARWAGLALLIMSGAVSIFSLRALWRAFT